MKISYLAENTEELRLISRWYFEEWGHLNSSTTQEKIYESLSSKLEKEDDFLCLIAVHEEGELVAVADLKYQEHKDYPKYKHWIGGVFVSSKHRGKGYASVLIEKAKEHVVNLRIAELYLQCEEKNEGLYLKHGFEPLHGAVHSGVNTTIFKFNTIAQ